MDITQSANGAQEVPHSVEAPKYSIDQCSLWEKLKAEVPFLFLCHSYLIRYTPILRNKLFKCKQNNKKTGFPTIGVISCIVGNLKFCAQFFIQSFLPHLPQYFCLGFSKVAETTREDA